MKELKTIKEQLIAQVQSQMGDLKCVDTKELGEVIDMIKDLAQAEYYCKVYEAMEEKEEERPETNNYYYTERYLPPMVNFSRPMNEYPGGRMYYGDGGSGSNSGGNSSSSSSSGTMMYSSRYGHEPGRSEEYYEREYPLQYLRDEREGRSPMKRKMYMEGKSNGSDSSKSMKDLESYMQDLTSDMMDLLDKATPEEKSIVQKKINTLASKLQNV